MTLYKHKNNTDVAACFLSQKFVPEMQAFVVKLIWFNIVNPNNVFALDKDTVVIQPSDFDNWLKYEPLN